MKLKFPIDPLFKHHILIALLLAIWVFIFLYFTEPLDVNEFSPSEKLTFLPGYGLLSGISYVLFFPFQKFIFRKLEKKWSIGSELLFLLFYCILVIAFARIYYLFIVVPYEPNPYSLWYMLKTIYFPALTTILPILIIGRFAFGKYYEKQLIDKKIEIKGEGNYEGLKIPLNKLLCIQSADNYIEVLYISEGKISKTLIRNKLSVIDNDIQELLRTHRSYLINPSQFQQWKIERGKHTIILNQDIKIPVSKTYLDSVKDILNLTTN